MAYPPKHKESRRFVVVNPASAGGATGRSWESIACLLHNALGSFDYAFTKEPRHATALTRKALNDGFSLIIAIGGDGTINEVASGFFDGQQPVAQGAALGVVPHGTGSDLNRSTNFGKSLKEACGCLANGHIRPIDVGHVRFTGCNAGLEERVFLNIVSFGCGAAAVRRLSSTTKWFGGKAAFTLATAMALVRYRDQLVTVSADDGLAEEIAITNYAICNGSYFGGGIRVAPFAQLNDGFFDATVWTGFGLGDFILKRRSLYDGTHVREPRTRTFRAKKFFASSIDRVLLEIDGEFAGCLPAIFEILPNALQLSGWTNCATQSPIQAFFGDPLG